MAFLLRRAALQFVLPSASMNVAVRKPMTLAEFLAWEERQPLRH